ncbi:MAG: family acetyltransferase [Flaviaesturariibacter sp.]|nr:family acetyltransferase [Flaviaesturariibacter sp.]
MEFLTFQTATAQDLPALVALVNNAYRGSEARHGWTHEADLIDGSIRTNEAELTELLSNPDAMLLAARAGTDIVGCVYLEKNGSELYLGMLSVNPRQQAGGIGRKLLLASEEHARRIGCRAVVMTVISVRAELIDWYKRNGYEPTGETEPFPEGKHFGIPRQSLEFIVMRKSV